MYSDASSIGCFPTFDFNTSSLSSLASIYQKRASSAKVTLLLGVLEVEGPICIRGKTGKGNDSEMALLKVVAGDEKGALCKIVAWRQIAEVWGGDHSEPALRRGDIVLFEGMQYPIFQLVYTEFHPHPRISHFSSVFRWHFTANSIS